MNKWCPNRFLFCRRNQNLFTSHILEGQFIILHRYRCACYICIEIQALCAQQWLSNVHSGIGYICARIQVNKMENPKLSYYSSQTTSMDISLACTLQPLVIITMTIFTNDLPTQNCTMIKLAWHIIQILILSSHCVAFSMIMEKSNMFG